MPPNLKNCLEKAQPKRFYNLDFLNNAFIYCFFWLLSWRSQLRAKRAMAQRCAAVALGQTQRAKPAQGRADLRAAKHSGSRPIIKGGCGPLNMNILGLKKAQKCVDLWA